MEINVIIFSRIQLLCEANKISIYALEKETGIKHGTIQKWKEAIPSLNNLLLVADYFGVSIDYLVGRCENELSHKDSATLTTVITELIITTKGINTATKQMDDDIQDILNKYGITTIIR